MSELAEARKKLFDRQEELHKVLHIGLGETASCGYDRRCAVSDPGRKIICEEYFQQLRPEYDAFAEAVRGEIARKTPFSPGVPIAEDDLWLWGGPTPEWGGSPDPDTLVKTARYFDAQNGIYVYGPTDRKSVV